jgi:hypothetical protein
LIERKTHKKRKKVSNKNDIPIDFVPTNLSFEYFKYHMYFQKIAELEPDLDKETINLTNIINNDYLTKKGLVYIFVIDGYIVKIGSTTTSIKERIKSYNCGKENYRKNGTCSTTNYFILQSFLKIGKKIEIFAYYPETFEINIFGDLKKDIPFPPKEYEKVLLSYLKEEGELPYLCTQT